MLQNHNTIVNALTQFANNNLSLRRFKVSFFEQFDNFSTSGDSFPILYAIPNEVSFKENIDVQSFRVYCVDILQKDRSNEQYILNDSLLVLRDLTNWLRQGDNGLNILNIPRAIPVNNFLVDFTCGWYIDIDIECEAITTDCAIPFSSNFVLTGTTCDIAYVTDFLTCETLIECQGYIDLGNEIINIYTILSGLTGQTTYQYWTSGSTGTNSIKAINSTGLEALGNNSVAIGNATTAFTESSFVAGVGSQANSFISTNESVPVTIYSACTITNNDPLYNSYGVVFSGDVSLEWQGYLYNYCSTFTLYNGTGSTITFDCGNLSDIYYDLGTDSTYIIDTNIIDDSFTSISGDSTYDYILITESPAFAIGTNVESTGSNAFGTGNNTKATGDYSHTEGTSTTASGVGSHAEGGTTTASGQYSHSEGLNTKSTGDWSHSEGQGTTASGYYTHAEGTGSIASGDGAHAEGFATKASGTYGSHAEGSNSTASGAWSHAEGGLTTASGAGSHSEGFRTIASGENSHAGGGNTSIGVNQVVASGYGSFVHGSASTASGNFSIVLGSNITGSTFNTVYVNKLNIKNVPAGTSVNNLGIDSLGNVIIGSTASTSFDTYTTGGTYSNGTAIFTNNTGGTFSITGYNVNDAVTANTYSVNPVVGLTATTAQNINLVLSDIFSYTLSANTTFSFSGNSNGKSWKVAVSSNPTTSGYTSTFTASPVIKWAYGITPVQTATVNKTDIFSFTQINGNIYGDYSQSF